ncbi:MAG: helix-turn-helix transcriptional regulator [Oscillospiraceae bacterium]|nr:helix-turn-helix transcriptional regulator [Oscillospiraceae bacterium]MBR6649668.1 helix-turn-helix transcriptional regulator [Bacteroidaceae bacterium]
MVNRVKEIITQAGLSDRAFALRCGITQNTLSRQLTGVSELSLSTINSILNNFPDVSAEWLLRGEGVMYKSQNSLLELNSNRMERLIDTITTLQETINEKSKTIQLLEEENRKLKTELTVKKIG